jgi:hypothetical protein
MGILLVISLACLVGALSVGGASPEAQMMYDRVFQTGKEMSDLLWFFKGVLDLEQLEQGRITDQPSATVSGECQRAIATQYLGLLHLQDWALYSEYYIHVIIVDMQCRLLRGYCTGMKLYLAVVDANGQRMSGTLDGATYWIGNYDECIRAKASYWNATVANQYFEHNFDAHYCRGWWQVSILINVALV